MSELNPKVDGYLRKHPQWREALERLRGLFIACGLAEEIKWRVPCYTFEGHNVVLFGCTQDYGAVGFLKGSLLKDPHGILATPGPNSQAARLFRFESLEDVLAVEAILKEYVGEAIEVERAGLKVAFRKTEDFEVPAEFSSRMEAMPALRAAFDALTPGRQRSWLIHFAAPKQSKTRAARVERAIAMILDGKGLHDR